MALRVHTSEVRVMASGLRYIAGAPATGATVAHTLKLSPQPQVPFALGLWNTNSSANSSST